MKNVDFYSLQSLRQRSYFQFAVHLMTPPLLGQSLAIRLKHLRDHVFAEYAIAPFLCNTSSKRRGGITFGTGKERCNREAGLNILKLIPLTQTRGEEQKISFCLHIPKIQTPKGLEIIRKNHRASDRRVCKAV